MGRPHIRHLPHCKLPSISATIEANLSAARLTNPSARIAGICLNTSSLDTEEAKTLCADWQEQYGVPVTDPVRFGIESIARHLKANF
ncbi:EBNA-1 nuclear protein [Vibrio ishigakensis]|uniref:EBNA-1 nuclear protein n=1 Tax=Vibrio ishigakensis TaxID=1481914 RepID=A0A0B8PLL7_9VIBR|nr:EBNA-1 nuclear protein [Vibrio ishigakensis]